MAQGDEPPGYWDAMAPLRAAVANKQMRIAAGPHPPFDRSLRCRKCQAGAQSATGFHKNQSGIEYLTWRCWACGFKWTTLTADAGDDARP